MASSVDNPQTAFIDAVTNSVLGVDDYLQRLQPDSAAGRRLAAEPTRYGPDDRQAWAAEMGRLAATQAWHEAHCSEAGQLRDALAEVPAVGKLVGKLRAGHTLEDVDLFRVKRLLYHAAAAVDASMELIGDWGVPADCSERLNGLIDVIHPGRQSTPRFHLSSQLSVDLAGLRDERRRKKNCIQSTRNALEDEVLADHGGTFDIHGHYHPPASQDSPPLDEDDRLHQDTGGWRLSDEHLRAAQADIDQIESDIEQVERDVRADLSDRLHRHIDWLEQLAGTLAVLDVRVAKVRLRRQLDGCWARPRTAAGIEIDGGRDLRLVDALGADDVQPVSLDLRAAPVVLTGANMGGKSVLLGLVGLCQWCAQHAMPVPARQCRYRPVDAIVYVGSDNPSAADRADGLSSFGREVQRLVDWWDRAPAETLWLLDELGRGTHPDEGAHIAGRVIGQLADRGDCMLAATHFPAVAALPGADKLRIAGLTAPDTLTELLADHDVRDALRAVMDYQPVSVETHDVPREARAVASALGLPGVDEK